MGKTGLPPRTSEHGSQTSLAPYWSDVHKRVQTPEMNFACTCKYQWRLRNWSSYYILVSSAVSIALTSWLPAWLLMARTSVVELCFSEFPKGCFLIPIHGLQLVHNCSWLGVSTERVLQHSCSVVGSPAPLYLHLKVPPYTRMPQNLEWHDGSWLTTRRLQLYFFERIMQIALTRSWRYKRQRYEYTFAWLHHSSTVW